MNGRRRAGPAALAVLLVVFPACRAQQDATFASRGAAAEAPASTTAAMAPVVTAGPLKVELLQVQRLSKDLVQVDLSAVNTGTAPIDLHQVLSSGGGGLDQATFTADSGDARTFVVRDEQGHAQCSDDLGVLAPGAQRRMYVRFVAFSPTQFDGTLELPGISAFSAVTVPAAGREPGGAVP